MVSFDVRKPFNAVRRGLFTPSGAATLGAEPLAITEGVGLDKLWDASVKGKGSPANTDDKEAEFGLAGAAVDVAEKGRLVKGAEVEANVSLEAAVGRGVDVA